jgi:gamma-glutamyltranspeptidase / glutathione hydrolase
MPFRDDIRSVTVPGCVDGWLALHGRYGRLPLDHVLAPAIGYAADGFPASPTLVARYPAIAHLAAAADYEPVARAGAGACVRRPRLAVALAELVEGGREAFYAGPFGRGLLDLGGGLYSTEDLARSQADWVEPLQISAWDHDVWTTPPNSQGYLSLAAAWTAARLHLPDDPDDEAWAHLLIEVAKHTGHDRPAVLHEDADGAALLMPGRLEPRLAAIGDRAGSLASPAFAGDTIFLCAVDRQRMGVSLIQSNASGWGSHLVEPNTGIFLQNRGIGFSLEPGHPAELAPGRRPPHTLAPALVTEPSGHLRATVGTMGGDGQPQVVLQLLARLLHNSQSPGRAVASGRWRLCKDGSTGFDTWDDPAGIVVEVEGHAAPWDEGLARRGHRVRRVQPHSSAFGHAHVIEVTEDGILAGAADHRALSGAAAGW